MPKGWLLTAAVKDKRNAGNVAAKALRLLERRVEVLEGE